MSTSYSEERKISLNDGHDKRLPRIPVNPRAHPFAIGVAVGITLLGSGIIPLVLYFALTHATAWPLSTILAIPASISGLVFPPLPDARTYALAKSRRRRARPLRRSSSDGSAWTLDYYGWNFLLGVRERVGGCHGGVIDGGAAEREDGGDVVAGADGAGVRAAWSCPRRCGPGGRRRGGCRAWRRGRRWLPTTYMIAEDVLAVDAKQGELSGAAWEAEYEYSVPFGELLARLDWMWGVTGLAVAGGVLGVIWGFEQGEMGWAVGIPDSILLCGHVLADILHLQLGRYHGYGRF
ncbi:MAG: hypothetical protein LQ345_005153 [Seirophora villosa]|nr:MAG: hypothetical protein LQ345_005153 [Seirophora villosa]